MKLTVYERIQLQNLLPKADEYITMKLIRKLRESLSFSEREIADIDFMNHWKCPECGATKISKASPKCDACGKHMIAAGMVHWDEVQALKVIKDIHIGVTMMNTCRDALKKLSDAKKLTEETMGLYEKFCVEVVDEDEEVK